MQRVKQLKVKSVGPIRNELTVDFDVDSPLTLIKGPNGLGKSTLLKCLTSLQTGYFPDATLGEILTNGEKRGYISGTFVDDKGQEYERYQGLGADKKRLLTLPNGEVLDKDKDIKQFLAKYFGCSASTLQKTVFVSQGNISNIISSDRIDRVKTIAELAGVNNAEAVWTAIGKKIGTYRLYPESIQELADASEDLRKAEEAYASAVKVEKNTPEPEDAASYYSILEAYTSGIKLLEERSRLVKPDVAQLDIFNKKIHDLTVAIEAEVSKLENIDNDKLVELTIVYKSNERAREREKEISVLKSKLDAWIATNPKRPEFDSSDLDEKRELLSQAKSVLSGLEETLTSLGNGICNACGQKIPDADTKIASAKTKKVELLKVIEGLVKSVNALTSRRSEIFELQIAFDKKMASYEQKRKEVDAFYAEYTDACQVSEEMYVDALAKLEERKKLNESIKEFVRQKTALEQDLSTLTSELLVYETRWKDLSARIESAPSRADAELAKEKINNINLQQTKLREIKAASVLAKGMYESALKAHSVAESKHAIYVRDSKIVEKLSYLRELFHRDNLPAKVSKTFIEEVADRANEYMQRFEADFSLEANLDEMSFNTNYSDGKVLGIHQESGGWSVVTSLCLRCAVSDLISSSMKTLILDESIIYLDKDNMARIPFVLEEIKAVNKTLGRQMLLVTHEQSLLNVADTIINLG